MNSSNAYFCDFHHYFKNKNRIKCNLHTYEGIVIYTKYSQTISKVEYIVLIQFLK